MSTPGAAQELDRETEPVEMGPEEEAELDRAIASADEDERLGNCITPAEYFAGIRRA